ncbi:hypothetical protein N2152v2_006253 [Parachlorella kessleri]
MAGAQHEENPNPAEEDSPLFRTDDFRIWCMKVQCPFAHQNEKAVRRDPRTHDYTGIACPDMKKQASCIRGDSCPYAHNVFEYWLHPTRYRTQLCNDGPSCQRSLCFFAHTMEELRVPAAKPYVSPETLARTSLEAIQRNPHPLGQQLANPAAASMRASGDGGDASGTGAPAVQQAQAGLPPVSRQQQLTGLQGQVPMGLGEGLVGGYGAAQLLQSHLGSAGRPSFEQQVLHSGLGATGRVSFQEQQQVQPGFGSAGRFSLDEHQLQARLGSTGRPPRVQAQVQAGFGSAGRVSAPAQQLQQPDFGPAGRFSLDERQLQARLASGSRPPTGQPQLQPGFGSAGRVSAPQPGFGFASRLGVEERQAQPGFGSAGRVSAPQPGSRQGTRVSFQDQPQHQSGFVSAGRLSLQERQQTPRLPLLPGATPDVAHCRSTSDLSRKSQDHMRLWLAEQLGPTLPPLAAASVAVNRTGSRNLGASTSCRLSSEAVRASEIAATSSLYRPTVEAPYAMAGAPGMSASSGRPPLDAGMYAAGLAPMPDAPESPLLSAGNSSGNLPGVASAEASALNGPSPKYTSSPQAGTEQDLAQALASLKIALTQQQVASSSGSNHNIVISTLHQILKDAVNQQGAAAASGGAAPSFQDLLAATPLASEAKLERPGSASSPNSITIGAGRLSSSSNV